MITTSFSDDLKFIFNKLKNNEYFAFSKYADGEFRILKNHYIDILAKENGEFKYDPNDNTDLFYRDQLIKSFQFQHPEYYVGIGCRCCMGDESFRWMLDNSHQKEMNVTWANIFVNSNYIFYKENIIPFYSQREIVLVCNHKSNLNALPFNVVKDFRVGTNAYKDDFSLVEEILNWIEVGQIENKLFLFCAGPFGNILAHRLFEKNPYNTYMDVGSTLDPLLGLGNTRCYLSGHATLNKSCIW
jgi:hypothetical protein